MGTQNTSPQDGVNLRAEYRGSMAAECPEHLCSALMINRFLGRCPSKRDTGSRVGAHLNEWLAVPADGSCRGWRVGSLRDVLDNEVRVGVVAK